MKKTVFILVSITVFYSCNQTSETETQKLITAIDSLRQEITELRKLQQPGTEKKDSATVVPKKISPVKKDTLAPIKKPEKKPAPPATPKIQKPKNDTTYHKYVNGKLSVKITPWGDDGRRHQFFYDLYGNLTYEIEDVNLSYQDVCRISQFHTNGAVKKVECTMNPGASRYWYESEMYFSTTNEPETRYNRQMPPDHIDMEEQRPWFWNKQTRQWHKQEIVKEQPIPQK